MRFAVRLSLIEGLGKSPKRHARRRKDWNFDRKL
jgi:hypothetical protein